MKTGKKLGAPLKGLEPRRRVNITIDKGVLKTLDDERKNHSRGDFIDKLVKKFLAIKDKLLISLINIFLIISLFC